MRLMASGGHQLQSLRLSDRGQTLFRNSEEKMQLSTKPVLSSPGDLLSCLHETLETCEAISGRRSDMGCH